MSCNLAHLSKPELRSVQLANFISECLVKDMEKRPFARKIVRHPFIASVTNKMDAVRKELKEEIQRQRNEGMLRRQAEVTTKHGKLKSDRKSKPQKIYMDDLGMIYLRTTTKVKSQILIFWSMFMFSFT